ncbi:hypothetical protein EON63_07170 [archaeon]|nr:MAG: hypothetical protein EON63_07170 [archaeon]
MYVNVYLCDLYGVCYVYLLTPLLLHIHIHIPFPPPYYHLSPITCSSYFPLLSLCIMCCSEHIVLYAMMSSM